MSNVYEDLARLNGSQEIHFWENGVCVAHMVAQANANLSGAQFLCESQAAVDRNLLAIALFQFSVGLFVAEGLLTDDEMTDLINEIKTLTNDNLGKGYRSPAPDYPF